MRQKEVRAEKLLMSSHLAANATWWTETNFLLDESVTNSAFYLLRSSLCMWRKKRCSKCLWCWQGKFVILMPLIIKRKELKEGSEEGSFNSKYISYSYISCILADYTQGNYGTQYFTNNIDAKRLLFEIIDQQRALNINIMWSEHLNTNFY